MVSEARRENVLNFFKFATEKRVNEGTYLVDKSGYLAEAMTSVINESFIQFILALLNYLTINFFASELNDIFNLNKCLF